MFSDTLRKQWRIAKSLNLPFTDIKDPSYIPCTIAYAVRKMEQLDSFAELPKDKTPPRSIWHNEYKLDWWFKEVLESNKKPEQDMYINMSEVE